MAKISSKHKPVLRIVLLSLLGVIGLVVLILIISIALSPVFDAMEKSKFAVMKTETEQIYKQLQQVSAGVEDWKYEASCINASSGGFQTFPDYSCSTKVSLEVTALSAQQLLTLHEKYYPVIDGSSALKSTSELDKQSPSQFGLAFVVSSAEKTYELVNGGEGCDYIAELAQAYNSYSNYNYNYGSDIKSGGQVIISLTCTSIAHKNWYE